MVTRPYEWEIIFYNGKGDQECRAKVFGGWLVKVETSTTMALAFVPDPEHEWHVVTQT